MQRTTSFLLKQPVVLNKANPQDIKEQQYIAQLRQKYKNKISQSRRSHNSFPQRLQMLSRTNKKNQQPLSPRSHLKEIKTKFIQSSELISIKKVFKELNIQPPNLRQKFFCYLKTAPFRRDKEHIKIISFYLKQYNFFIMHPKQMHQQLSINMILKTGLQCLQSDIVLVENSLRTHKKFNLKGSRISHSDIVPQQSYICIDKNKYKSIVDQYANNNYLQVQNFIKKHPLFREIDESLIKKIANSTEVNFKTKGENLYQVQDPADKVYIVYKGKVVRKIIIQIQKNNRLPLQKQLTLTNNTVYQVGIQFNQGDIVGYLQLIEEPPLTHRRQTISVVENSIIFSISYKQIQQLKLSNIKWLRKQKFQKYPKSYQDICNYYQQKISFNKKVKKITKQTLQQKRRSILVLDDYKIKNIKYVRSQSVYKLRKSMIF